MKLPLPDPRAEIKRLRGEPWHIRNWTNPKRAALRDEELHITHDPRAVGMRSGSGFHANVFKPATKVVLSYEVFFPKNFMWVKGGKLPGLGIGPDPEHAATGAQWSPDCGSFRVMWREKGQAIGYLYLPLHISPNKKRDGTIRIQNDAFENAAGRSLGKPAGIDLWFHSEKPMFFKRGKWNTVRMEVQLNTTGTANGSLKLTINGETRDLDNVLFRKKDDVKLNMLIFASFFGGSSAEWRAKKAEVISYRDFEVEAD